MSIMGWLNAQKRLRKEEKVYAQRVAMNEAQQKLSELKERRKLVDAREAIRQEKKAQRAITLKPYTEAAQSVSRTLAKVKARRQQNEKKSASKIVRTQTGTTGGGVMGMNVNDPDWLKGR